MIYIPILKTKTFVEKDIIEKEAFFMQEHSMLPYIEITKDYNGDKDRYKTCPKIFNALSGIKHFEEFYNKDKLPLESILKLYDEIPTDNKYIIASIRINNELELRKNELFDFIRKRHDNCLKVAIRITSGLDLKSVDIILKNLNEDDWLLIDLKEMDFDVSKSYIYDIEKRKFKNIAVFTIERPAKTTGEAYKDFDQDYVQIFLNTSVVNAIKEKEYPFNAFGSYVSLKDSLSETGGASACYGVFLLYNGTLNKFYCVSSNKKDSISLIYTEVRDKVKKLYEDKTSELNKIIAENEKTRHYLFNLLQKHKRARAVDFYFIGAIQYLTEIAKLIS